MTTLECPMCNGEGFIDDLRPGGYFSRSEQQWYPLEESKPCPACRGTGHIEAPRHPNTFNQTVDYQQIKLQREAKRSATNDVVIQIFSKAA
jgi:RecJ-like exonuclease